MILSPKVIFDVFIFALGLVVGSFLNVVVARLPHGKSVTWPGSHCPKCQSAIRWYDNVPVLSYLMLRAKCRACRAPISVRYPVIELITGVLFLAIELHHGHQISWLLFARYLPFAAILVAITFIDLELRIIPDRLSLGGLALGLITGWADPALGADLSAGWAGIWPALVRSCSGAALGFGLFYGLAWTYWRLTGRSGMGGGDIKLLAMLGAFLGPMGVLSTIFVSSVFGSVVGIGWAIYTRKRDLMTVAIPFGPFLVVGGLYYDLLGDKLWPLFTIPT